MRLLRLRRRNILAWHFVGDTLRDGRPIPADGATLRHDGPLVMWKSGLHASRRLIDALAHAPGETLCRVRCGGDIEKQSDELLCRERTILWRLDAGPLLRVLGRTCALDVVHLWSPPPVVLDYLMTGDEAKRAAARGAAMAASDAANDAWGAAWAAWAAWAAASIAASEAVWAASDATDAASAARGALWVWDTAAWSAARGARGAVWAASAATDAASVARGANDAASVAASEAVWAASAATAALGAPRGAAQNKRLLALVAAARNGKLVTTLEIPARPSP